jgi:hypothetical protein
LNHPTQAHFQILGKTGRIVKIYPDGDLRVKIKALGNTWTLNPKCVTTLEENDEDKDLTGAKFSESFG